MLMHELSLPDDVVAVCCMVCPQDLESRSFFCDHIFAPTCYIRTPNNSVRCLLSAAGDNNKPGIVASSFVRRTSAIFNGGAHWRINSRARIMALNMQDYGFRFQCLQFHHMQWAKQLTTVGQVIQGTFPETQLPMQYTDLRNVDPPRLTAYWNNGKKRKTILVR